MVQLESFRAGARVAVIGASGGIGAAMVEQLVALHATSCVYAFARGLDEQSDAKIHLAPIDITRERTVRNAAALAASEGPLDLVVVSTGLLHDGNGVFPEKSLRNIDAGVMTDVLRVNTIGPALVAKHFLPHLRQGSKSVFAALSARVGSIGDNRLTLAGSYGPQLQVEANARFSNLRQFGLGIGGALNGDVRFAAESDAFSASGDVDGENLAWGEYRIDTLGTEFDLPATGKGTASLRVESTEEGSVSVEIDGRFDEEQWSGEITDFTARRAPVGEWTLREATGFSLSRSGFSLPGACLRSASTAGEICVALDYDATGPLSFETTVKALPVAALPRNLPEGATVLGNLSAEMRGEFANGQLNSSATASIDGLGLLAAYEDDRASARFESASASATVVDNRLTGEFDFRLEDGANHASGTIDIDDLFDRQSPLSGNGRLVAGRALRRL